MDLPLLMAAAFLFGPIVAGTIAFLGFLDVRELRKEVSLGRALYNRAQTSLSVMAAAAVFALMGGRIGVWPYAAFAGTLALAADCVVNYSLVLSGAVLRDGAPGLRVLNNMRFGRIWMFSLCYLCFGFLGLMLAEIYQRIGTWGLASFVAPVLLARQTFSHTQQLQEAGKELELRGRALREASERMADERRDERLNVAAGLHDEVLPPLYKVHLMGQVLRQDLASGQLLALEDDVPQLVEATERANAATRELIRDLRRSSLGSSGLTQTLRLLARNLAVESTARIRLELDEETGGSPLVQLLAYQIAREAIRNALRHADATEIRVRLTKEEGDMRLLVEDNGRGFDPDLVDAQDHFGLALIKERTELAGGVVQFVSGPQGTRILARLPAETSAPQTSATEPGSE